MTEMYQIAHGSSRGVLDAAEFIETINGLERNSVAEARQIFDNQSDVFVTRAPGRLDVMGGIADYSGSLVLQMPIREATFAALQRSRSRKLTIVSLVEEPTRKGFFEMSLDEFENEDAPIEYETARARFRRETASQWAAYVAGVFLVLMREREIRFREGARVLIDSRVPEGKGVGSSAALEVAAMQAVAAAYDLALTPRELALLCQRVENLVVGAPCGVMDQMTAACGEEDCLLALLCQPAEVKATIPIPDGVSFWGLDSGVKHSIGGADYASVRAGAFMGYRMIADLAGLSASQCGEEAVVQIDDPRWGGYLANLTPEEFKAYEGRLPEQIEGAAFLSRFQGATDRVAPINPNHTYAVRRPTAHPVYENDRVKRFADLLREEVGEDRLEELGDLMYRSHASYSACGLGSEGTDLLVRLVREAGPERGLYGARITGGGSGGTVAVIGRADAGGAVENLAEGYAEATGYRPHIFSGSSAGSAAFGFVRLRTRD
ncbi:MAG TPA: galactokinase family protein [Blastocatellia bacterium]|nr:galactokinase family protein [Blastocatellia bacterium]